MGMSLEETEILKDFFEGIDTDNDGFVSWEEVKSVINEMDMKGEKILKEDFNQLDTDEDGLLDLDQFLELFRLMKGSTYPTSDTTTMPVLTTEKILALQEAFNAKGPDANDRVKLEDLVSVVKKAEPTATDEAIQRLLKQYDTENNNALGLDKVLCVVEDL